LADIALLILPHLLHLLRLLLIAASRLVQQVKQVYLLRHVQLACQWQKIARHPYRLMILLALLALRVFGFRLLVVPLASPSST
jgi:hypothetical protein